MKINSLKLAKILSFGPLQELNQFKTFNLFIGKNGSGKSNVLKILEGLNITFDMINGYKIPDQIPNRFGTQEINHINVFKPWFDFNNNVNHASKSSDIHGLLELEYEEITHSDQITPHKKTLRFSDDSNRTLRYIEGDITILKRRVNNIQVPETEFEFYKDLSLFLGSKARTKLPLLNFGLFYIFGYHYTFRQDGTFTQGRISSGTPLEENTASLPSGVLNCSKILTRYFMSDCEVILIDEPELHLEPRIIRRFFQFLVWLICRWKENKTIQEQLIFSKVDEIRKSNYNKSEDGESYSVWAIYEGAIDGKQKFLDIRTKKESYDRPKQLFIASHSSVFINEFFKLNETAAIYEFNLSSLSYNLVIGNYDENHQYVETSIPKKGVFSTVRKIKLSHNNLLDNLGCKGSDILQTNGIIWVEGPSDVIYISKWLEMYIKENKKNFLSQGRDFEFQMYGGTLLDSLCLIKFGNDEKEEYKKLVSMFSFSRNAYVVIDSDAIKKDSGEIIDKSNFANAKSFIKNQFDILSAKGRNLGLWYKAGNHKIRTMEDYLDEDSIQKIKDNNWTKKIAAQKITESWSDTKKLSSFPNNLSAEIEELYNLIFLWNH